MSVIHALSASKSDDQREKEKQKLERDYEKSDKKLDELVSRHYDELTRVMQAFARVSTQVCPAVKGEGPSNARANPARRGRKRVTFFFFFFVRHSDFQYRLAE